MKIVVLAGGYSPERDVSLSSGSLIANALIENGHSVALIDLYKGCDTASFFDKKSGKVFNYQVPALEPDLDAIVKETGNAGAFIGKNVIESCRRADVTFIALHGAAGENGQLQAVFDMYGIKYTGTGYAGSLLAMDKGIAKTLMKEAGISTPEWVMYDTEAGDTGKAAGKIGVPCVVKPCGCGSSVGVSLIYDRDGIAEAVESAKKYERAVLIERLIKGREFSVGVLGGDALPVIEIIPKTGFYDYKNKYQPGLAVEVCPADIPKDVSDRLLDDALNVHNALKLGYYSRIDFILDDAGCHYCLEANTLPGMTPTSLLPQEAAAVGVSYEELCEKIVTAALETEVTV